MFCEIELIAILQNHKELMAMYYVQRLVVWTALPAEGPSRRPAPVALLSASPAKVILYWDPSGSIKWDPSTVCTLKGPLAAA